jgi:hypothetical protein
MVNERDMRSEPIYRSYTQIGGRRQLTKVGEKQLQPDFVSCSASLQLKVLGVVDNSCGFCNDVGMMWMFIGLPLHH